MLQLFPRTMCVSIHFDHQAKRDTGKVGYVRTDRMLAAKSSPTDGVAPEPRPANYLGIRQPLTKAFRERLRFDAGIFHCGIVGERCRWDLPNATIIFASGLRQTCL